MAAKRRGMAALAGTMTDEEIPDFTHPQAGGIAPEAVPTPHAAEADGALSPEERDDLTTCEAALDELRTAFWAAGKALQTIRDARLYRENHATFEDYCQARWDMTRTHADRLIRAWPLAERLAPIGANAINEGQVRELVALATRHGFDAAATVYGTVADEAHVTAAVLRGAVAALPPDRFDPVEAAQQVRAYLAGRLAPSPDAAAEPDTFTTQIARVRTALRRTIHRDTLRTAARQQPDQVRAFTAELRQLADELDRATR